MSQNQNPELHRQLKQLIMEDTNCILSTSMGHGDMNPSHVPMHKKRSVKQKIDHPETCSRDIWHRFSQTLKQIMPTPAAIAFPFHRL